MGISNSFISVVPAILRGPVDMTLEYSDDLTAIFTCTAFGGDDATLEFDWDESDSSAGLNDDTEMTITNTNNSVTSTITTNTLTLDDRGSEYACEVEYQSGAFANMNTATLNIGKT